MSKKVKKRAKKYIPKTIMTPQRLEKIVDSFREDFFRLETMVLMKLHAGEVSRYDLNDVRSYLWTCNFILMRRAEDEFKDVPVEEWVKEIGVATRAITEAITRSYDHETGMCVFTGDELKAVIDIVAQCFPFLHDELEKSPRHTAYEILACAMLLDDIIRERNGQSREGNVDTKTIQRYYDVAVKSVRRGIPVSPI